MKLQVITYFGYEVLGWNYFLIMEVIVSSFIRFSGFWTSGAPTRITVCEVRKYVRALAGIFNDKIGVFVLYFASKKGSQQLYSLWHWLADTSLASLTYKNRKPEGLNFTPLQLKDEALRLCL